MSIFPHTPRDPPRHTIPPLTLLGAALAGLLIWWLIFEAVGWAIHARLLWRYGA
jgi:hypothetical protein